MTKSALRTCENMLYAIVCHAKFKELLDSADIKAFGHTYLVFLIALAFLYTKSWVQVMATISLQCSSFSQSLLQVYNER